MTIWKFLFDVNDRVSMRMPGTPRVLLVECQRGEACLWAEVDPDAPLREHRFRVFGTGHPRIPAAGLEHVASFQQPPFVWHMYRELAR